MLRSDWHRRNPLLGSRRLGSIIKGDTGAAVGLLFGGIVEDDGFRAVDFTLMTPLPRVIEVCKVTRFDVELPDA